LRFVFGFLFGFGFWSGWLMRFGGFNFGAAGRFGRLAGRTAGLCFSDHIGRRGIIGRKRLALLGRSFSGAAGSGIRRRRVFPLVGHG
jgi:hypothetical protein